MPRPELLSRYVLTPLWRRLAGRHYKDPAPFSPETRRRLAVHEAGHAVLRERAVHASPIEYACVDLLECPHFVDYFFRFKKFKLNFDLGGFVQPAFSKPRFDLSEEEIYAEITCSFGGPIAEKIILDKSRETIQQGGEGDFTKAQEGALIIVLKKNRSTDFWADARSRRGFQADLSEDEKIEVEQILKRAYADGKRILQQNLDFHSRIVEALLENDWLTGAEIKALGSAPGKLPAHRL